MGVVATLAVMYRWRVSYRRLTFFAASLSTCTSFRGWNTTPYCPHPRLSKGRGVVSNTDLCRVPSVFMHWSRGWHEGLAERAREREA